MAIVVAIIVFVVTLAISALVMFGQGMSDNPADNSATGFISIFVGGTIFSILIGLSHWAPHIGW
jgi:hypothetical protein